MKGSVSILILFLIFISFISVNTYLILDHYRVLLNPNISYSQPALFQVINFVKSLSFYYNITRLPFSVEYSLSSNAYWNATAIKLEFNGDPTVIVEKRDRYEHHNPPLWDYLSNDTHGFISSVSDIILREQGVKISFPPTVSARKKCISIEAVSGSLSVSSILLNQAEMEKHFTRLKRIHAKEESPFDIHSIAYFGIYDQFLWPFVRDRYAKVMNIRTDASMLLYEGCFIDFSTTPSSGDWLLIGDNELSIPSAMSFVMGGDSTHQKFSMISVLTAIFIHVIMFAI